MAVGVPCMLVTSCSSTFSADRLVQHILGTEDAVVEVTANDAVRFDPWTIDNKYCSADINLVSENGVNRQKAQEWCIKHGFELVELRLEELPEEDDDFPESTGVKRIVQTSNANVWSNVVMKNERN
ncbi:hypothetical protein MJG53_013593 [Ovis ammon polii x Ovis aries]|uniref:Uncharacterized protein n=1 Tax=Ovis ammon polii x Ovis aries TaxID=2918886 RepID=A0ACB9UIZ4_9CETA|nr:hypothetical protein MJG53_013593 [Ovis ammon polii x Ovis aries]